MEHDYSFSENVMKLKRECKRCFYDVHKLKIKRPESIFASITTGLDRVMKEYQDQYRGSLPVELKAWGVTGTLWGTKEQVKKIRHWNSGLKAFMQISGKSVRVIGAFDDLIVEGNVTYSPHDTKSHGNIPKTDGAEYYQGQADIYGLLLRENGMEPSGKAYFQYWYPFLGPTGHMMFKDNLQILTVDPQRAINEFGEAVAILEGKQPSPSPTCTYCAFADARAIQGVANAVKGLAST